MLSNNAATTPESDISFSYPIATSSPTRPLPHRDQARRQDLPLRIAVLNCWSIKSRGKPAQLKNMITSLQADIIIGSESWLNPSIKSSEVFLDGFNCYPRDRPGGTGGGVFLLVSKQFDSSEPEDLNVDNNTDCEMVWAKVKIQGSADLYIGSIYRPSDNGDQEYLQHLHSRITRILTDKGAHLWIGGDFNLPDIDWDQENVKPYASNSSVCNQLLTIAKDAYLDQTVAQPTRITETTSNKLELFFTTNAALINKVETIPGISDHEAVFIVKPAPNESEVPHQGKYSSAGRLTTQAWRATCGHTSTNLRKKLKQKMLNVSGPPSKRRYIPSWTNTFPLKCSGVTRSRNHGLISRSRTLEGNRSCCLNNNGGQGQQRIFGTTRKRKLNYKRQSDSPIGNTLTTWLKSETQAKSINRNRKDSLALWSHYEETTAELLPWKNMGASMMTQRTRRIFLTGNTSRHRPKKIRMTSQTQMASNSRPWKIYMFQRKEFSRCFWS